MSAYIEDAIGAYFGRKHCILVGSGTTALYVCFRALELPTESKILFPDFTCETAINAALFAGLVPFFCDVDLSDYNMNSASVTEVINRNGISAIVPTHIFGHLIDVDEMMMKVKTTTPIIEDCAQGYGGTISGKRAGQFGLASVISFGEGKLLSCDGGGAILVDDDNFADRCQLILEEFNGDDERQSSERQKVMIEMVALRRQNPSIKNFTIARTAIFRKHKFGYLSLCTEKIRTAILGNFHELDNIIELRKSQSSQLDDLLSEFNHIEIPQKLGSNVLWRYSFTVNDGSRNRLFEALRASGCSVTKFFEPCHKKYGLCDQYFPNTARIWKSIINLKFSGRNGFDFTSLMTKIKYALT